MSLVKTYSCFVCLFLGGRGVLLAAKHVIQGTLLQGDGNEINASEVINTTEEQVSCMKLILYSTKSVAETAAKIDHTIAFLWCLVHKITAKTVSSTK